MVRGEAKGRAGVGGGRHNQRAPWVSTALRRLRPHSAALQAMTTTGGQKAARPGALPAASGRVPPTRASWRCWRRQKRWRRRRSPRPRRSRAMMQRTAAAEWGWLRQQRPSCGMVSTGPSVRGHSGSRGWSETHWLILSTWLCAASTRPCVGRRWVSPVSSIFSIFGWALSPMRLASTADVPISALLYLALGPYAVQWVLASVTRITVSF